MLEVGMIVKNFSRNAEPSITLGDYNNSHWNDSHLAGFSEVIHFNQDCEHLLPIVNSLSYFLSGEIVRFVYYSLCSVHTNWIM